MAFFSSVTTILMQHDCGTIVNWIFITWYLTFFPQILMVFQSQCHFLNQIYKIDNVYTTQSKNWKNLAFIRIPSLSENTMQVILKELNKNILTFQQGNLTVAF